MFLSRRTTELAAQSLHLHSHLLEFGTTTIWTNPGISLHKLPTRMPRILLFTVYNELSTREAATFLPRWRYSSLVTRGPWHRRHITANQ